MSGSGGDMLAASRRDPNFRGIDSDALGQLVKQTTDAGNAIRGWLGSHQPPPGVSAAGYSAAADVERWLNNQLGMLTRRRNYAISHPDVGGQITPPATTGKLGKTSGGAGPASGSANPGVLAPSRRNRITPAGAGPQLGNYPTTGAAAKVGFSDAMAIGKAEKDHTPIPAGVWQHLKADAGDPDYTRALIERLGPAGVAGLIAAAHHDPARLHTIEQALGTASHHLPITKTWLNGLLAESARLHDRGEAVTVLTGAHLAPKARTALDTVLGLGHVTRTSIPDQPKPPPHHPVAAGAPHLVTQPSGGERED